MSKALLLRVSLLLPLLAGAPAMGQVAAPTVSVTDIKALPTPLPLPYDEEADADADVARAFERARASGKRVLLNFGGDWCPDCRVLAGITELPEVKGFLEAHYEVVKIDVGRFNKNMHIPARFGVQKLRGVPSVLVLTPEGGLLNASDSSELANARGMTPQAIADWLARYAAPGGKG